MEAAMAELIDTAKDIEKVILIGVCLSLIHI